MRNVVLILALALLAVPACKDPSKGKPGAKVEAPRPEPRGHSKGAEVIKLSPANTKIGFVGSSPVKTHVGSFARFSGSISTVDGKAESAQIRLTIDMTSIAADHPRLTAHLKSPDFFAVKEHPKATFVSTAIKKGGAQGASHTITGNLTMRGVKKSISFPATISVTADKVVASSELVLKRFDWKIAFKKNGVREGVVVKLHIAAPRKKG